MVTGHDANTLHVADRHTLQVNRLATANALRVIEVGDQGEPGGEEAGGSAHQEDENSQRHQGHDDGDADPEFRPPELLLTRQGDAILSQNTSRNTYKTLICNSIWRRLGFERYRN